jgi:Nuclease A inhibitor-like protein
MDIQEKDSTPSIQQQIEALCHDLFYPSESDEPIVYIDLDKLTDLTFDSQWLVQLSSDVSLPIEVTSMDSFFDPVTQIKDWYGDEEKAIAQQFSQLKDFVINEMSDFQALKVGEVEKQYYLIGKSKTLSKWIGIKTMVVET